MHGLQIAPTTAITFLSLIVTFFLPLGDYSEVCPKVF